MLLVHTMLFLSLIISSLDCIEIQSGFVEEYLNKNYIPIINQTHPIAIKKVDSTLSCLLECLTQKDCSVVGFNQTNFQCLFYNIYPIIDQELFPDDHIVTFVFQRTIQLSASISNTSWLVSRLNATIPSKVVSIQNPRCLVIDQFGYLLTLEAKNNTTFINRYDRTNLMLIQSTSLMMTFTSNAMLSYYDGKIFVSPTDSIIYIFDDINFDLLGTISPFWGQPRDIIFIENQNMMIIAGQTSNRLFFCHFYSPTNCSYFSNMQPPSGDPQGLLKINDTFFYVTTYGDNCIYSYNYNGTNWIASLFANVSQTLGISSINGGHIHIDNIGRRWMMVVGFGVVIYDQWGTPLGQWKFGKSTFDIYISNDYSLIVSDFGNSSLTLYEPNMTI